MVRTRVLFGALMIAIFLGLGWLDDFVAQRIADDWTPTWLINIGLYFHEGFVLSVVVAVIIAAATLELGRLCRAAGHAPAVTVALIANVGLVLIPWLVRNGLTADVSSDPMTDYRYTVTWLILWFLIAGVRVAIRRRTDGAIAAIATTLLLIVYLGGLGAYFTRLRMWSGSPWLVLYYVFVTKVCDIGAYFTGLAIGRHGLIRWLSPKKTWEGLIGGVATSVLVAVGAARLIADYGPPRLAPLMPDLRHAAIFGLIMALLGQAGDLLESLFKRDAGSKDSGAVVPAFGGVMDIIDSLLVTVPVAYWLLLE
ncbi:MAG: phosphatidate cytidylyltransferase [Phycisphaerae bacterium]|nr:phosphatidate cytidylyltransferase [Phycisphaerae bacterium]